jgi:hypothetical protein
VDFDVLPKPDDVIVEKLFQALGEKLGLDFPLCSDSADDLLRM